MSQQHTNDKKSSQNEPKVPIWNFNYWISYTFLKNSRLTVLALVFLIGMGLFTGLQLKTTGFPSPEVPIALVQTTYPGASSEIVAKDVTVPLEGAIKEVEGVQRFSSNSNNSFSNIIVFINEDEDVNIVINKIDSAVKSVTLPTGVQTPRLEVPDIGGPSVILAVAGNNLDDIYTAYSEAETKLNQITEISKVTENNELNEVVTVSLRDQDLATYNLRRNDIEDNLRSFGESVPSVSNVALEGNNSGILTSVVGNDLEALRNLSIPYSSETLAPQQQGPNLNQQFVNLNQIADIQTELKYKNSGKANVYAFYNTKTNQEEILQTAVLTLRTVEDTDQAQFVKTLEQEMNKISSAQYITRDELAENYDENKTYIVLSYSVNEDNQEQVDQVVGGIVGSPIGDQWWGNVGYLLGGIQLVILVMIAFVSWRAALIAAAAIPLSLIFSTIYIWLIGEQLNTLVLFSLVLVLGLVVDPALVILESIQRKLDAGDRGINAVLAAVKDVGNGIFLASLTNVIVFVPFGILSGIFGQIFAYIPATVIPAVIGSYVVPLVFLAWLGGLILKPNKNALDDEEKNLWPIAKWFIKTNQNILNGSRWVRLLIAVAGFVIPVVVAGALFYSGAIKQVQFAETDDGPLLSMSGSFLPNITAQEKVEVTNEVMQKIAKNKDVRGVVESGEAGFGYFIFLSKEDQRDLNAKEIASDINQEIQNSLGSNVSSQDRKFFDIKIVLPGTGGPSVDYQIVLTIREDNLDIIRDSSISIGQEIQSKLCLENNEIKMNDSCSQDNLAVVKIDDGFTEKDNFSYDIRLDREALIKSGLALQGQRGVPLSRSFNTAIANQFFGDDQNSVSKVLIDEIETDIFVKSANPEPTSATQAVENIAENIAENTNALNNVARVEETTPKASIQRIRGQTVGLVQARLKPELENNQDLAGQAGQIIVDYYAQEDGKKAIDLGLSQDAIQILDNEQNFFDQLVLALLLAIAVSYIVLALFFNSLTQPLSILYTIPLALMGVLPALAAFVGGQFGLLEIIGVIILVGIVENVAIFLIDSANQKIQDEKWDPKRAISYASGIRFRPVLLTSVTAIASLAPLAVFSPFYRSIAVVIMFGILVSGITSLITTPILFIFFRWASQNFAKEGLTGKLSSTLLPILGIVVLVTGLGFLVAPVSVLIGILLLLTPLYYFIYWGIKDRPSQKNTLS
jgi:HAE1 family hydrophobic/amphiphilic exporter-1